MNQYTTTPMDTNGRTYDNNGNLLTRTGTNPPAGTFAYDYKNRMVRFTETISGKRHDYVYDCLGRLIKTVVDVGGPTEGQTLYYYKGHQIVEERDGTDTVQATFVYGNYIDEVITMRRLNTDYYYVRDDQYNVMAIANSSGVIVESYDYGDFGRPVNPTTRQPITSSTVGNPFFFTGRAFDWQTQLYDYRTRHYDPIAGRFTSRDTIGIWGDELNMGNAFAYVGNNPWTYVDPDGRCGAGDVWQTILMYGGGFLGAGGLAIIAYATAPVWIGVGTGMAIVGLGTVLWEATDVPDKMVKYTREVEIQIDVWRHNIEVTNNWNKEFFYLDPKDKPYNPPPPGATVSPSGEWTWFNQQAWDRFVDMFVDIVTMWLLM